MRGLLLFFSCLLIPVLSLSLLISLSLSLSLCFAPPNPPSFHLLSSPLSPPNPLCRLSADTFFALALTPAQRTHRNPHNTIPLSSPSPLFPL